MKLKVYSLPGCPYCKRVERLIKNMDLKAEIIKVKTMKHKEEIKKKLTLIMKNIKIIYISVCYTVKR